MIRTLLRTALIALSGALLVPGATAATRAKLATGTAQIAKGQQIFQRQCAPCHGGGPGDDGAKSLPGTDALNRKYKGALPPELEKRRDLTADLIRAFVRNGSGAMPMFRKAELTDADVDAIAAYIADKAGKPGR